MQIPSERPPVIAPVRDDWNRDRLAGVGELYHWARRNNATWSAACRQSQVYNLSDMDEPWLIAYMLLLENIDLRRQLVNQTVTSNKPIIILNENRSSDGGPDGNTQHQPIADGDGLAEGGALPRSVPGPVQDP